MLKTADEVVNRVALECHLPLEDSKHEKLVLRKKRRKMNSEVRWVKWVGIIMDESLTFREHWKSRSANASKMLGQLSGLGNSKCGMSANSWTVYTGMIRAVALGCRTRM